MDMEQHLPKPIQKSQNYHQKDVTMAFYNVKEQINLEKDTTGFCLEASHLQVRERIQFPKNEAPDSAVLCPTVFTSRRLTSAKPTIAA